MSPGSSSSFRDKATHPLAGVTVLQIVPDLDPGAPARAAIDIAAALARVGANALVASRGGRLVSELQAKGGVFAPFPGDARNPIAMTLNIRRLAQLIKAERVDLVHARSRAPAWVAYGATRIVKTPFVTSFQGSYARGGPLALRYNSIMARGDCVIADSARTADRIEELYPAAKDKVRVIVGGVDCRVFAPKAVAPARVQAVRRLWGAAPDERIVLLAAGPRSSGDYKILIEAVRLLADHDAAGIGAGATKFIVAAEAPPASFAREIEAAIAKAGLQGIMRLSSAGPDRPAALLAASVVVALSANPEAFAGLALEAQAMGAPVIVATQSAAAETVLAPPEVDEAARSGWPAPCDAAALARALSEVLSLGATARDRLSLRARAHIEAHFPIEQMWAQTLAAYASARGDVR